MKPLSRFNRFCRKIPVNFAVILMCILWIVPTLGLFVTSFRTREAVRTTGWWTAFAGKQKVLGESEYTTYCASCHGSDGKAITAADLTNAEVINQYPSASSLLVMLRQPVNGDQSHLKDPVLPSNTKDAISTLSNVTTYLQSLSGQTKQTSQFTLKNYVDAVVGYKGTQDYLTDCEEKVTSTMAVYKCNASDIFYSAGIGASLVNTLLVAIPSTLLVIFFGALAAYAFAWLDFKGRQWIFALLIGLQVVPL